MRNPYTFPRKSRKAQIAYLAEHDSYGGWNHPHRGWSPLSWNVRIGNVNWRSPKGEYKLSAALDDQWQAYVDSNQELFGWICEDMASGYLEGEYMTYPGDDQGEWEFTFAGRSGGQMLLAKWQSTDFLRSFQGDGHWRDWLASGITTEALRTLYRAVRCMDQDFTKAKIDAEFEYHLNFRRSEWEEEQRQAAAMKAGPEFTI